MARALLFLVIIGLAVYALADISTSDDRARRGLPRGLWMLIALVPVVGAVAWILTSRAQRDAGGGTAPGRGGPVAPDDDPEFLWRLEQDRIRREREARGGDDPRTPDGSGDLPGDPRT
jgi:hypothetical protein